MYTPIKTARDRAILAFVGMYIATIVAIALNIYEVTALKAIQQNQGMPIQQLSSMEDREQLMEWVYWATFVGAAIGFLHWLYTASANLAALGLKNPGTKPWESIAWWFCPVICLYQPYQIMKALWRGSDPNPLHEQGLHPEDAPVSTLIGPWWITWLIGIWGGLIFPLLSNGSTNTVSGAISIKITSEVIDASFLVCSLVSLILASVILSQISRNQEEKYSVLTAQNDGQTEG